MAYIVGNPATREPHPDSPTFRTATEAVLWAMHLDLPAHWWPIPLDADPQPARLEGTL